MRDTDNLSTYVSILMEHYDQRESVYAALKDSKQEPGVKFDGGKTRWDLMPWSEAEEIAKVLTFGADKYSADNWKSVADPEGRYFAAAMRHLVAWEKGERIDPESGFSHLAHAACCLMFLMYFDCER